MSDINDITPDDEDVEGHHRPRVNDDDVEGHGSRIR